MINSSFVEEANFITNFSHKSSCQLNARGRSGRHVKFPTLGISAGGKSVLDFAYQDFVKIRLYLSYL